MSRVRQAGTTLIEVLVVMVVFLVGILAVVQIFPKGFQILLLSRSSSMATALSRDEIERLKSRPDQLPEAIVALYPDGTIDTAHAPGDLGPAGTSLLEDGTLMIGNQARGDWARFSGANTVRHVVGEGRRVPTPALAGEAGNPNMFGGLLVLQFNPVDTISGTGIRAYGNDLNVNLGDWSPTEDRNDYDAYLLNPAAGASLKVPTTRQGVATPVTRYVVSFSAYVDSGSGNYVKRDFTNIPLSVPNVALIRDDRDDYPLYQISLQAAVTGTLGSVDPQSVRVRREYRALDAVEPWSPDDVYQFRVLNGPLGVLLFHPNGSASMVPRPDGQEPLMARVDYDVLDWRVLREEFRFPSGSLAQHRLAVGSLKVGGLSGPDGRIQGGIPNIEGDLAPAALRETGLNRSDNFVLQDLVTGGIFLEKPDGASAITGTPIVQVDKTLGIVTARDMDGNDANGTTVPLLLADGTLLPAVQIDNRAVRALYMVRNEYAVQVLKSPSRYTESSSRPGYGQFGLGPIIGGVATRIYFPASDVNRKISIGTVNYRVGTGPLMQLSGQDFVIRPALASDPIGLPFVDITESLPNVGAAALPTVTIDATTTGFGALEVKGASVAVRTIWNPETMRFTADPDVNLQQRLNNWTRGYRRSTNETYLEQGGLLR